MIHYVCRRMLAYCVYAIVVNSPIWSILNQLCEECDHLLFLIPTLVLKRVEAASLSRGITSFPSIHAPLTKFRFEWSCNNGYLVLRFEYPWCNIKLSIPFSLVWFHNSSLFELMRYSLTPLGHDNVRGYIVDLCHSYDLFYIFVDEILALL